MKDNKSPCVQWLVLGMVLVLATGCGKNRGQKTPPGAADLDDDSTALVVESAVSAANGAMNDVEQTPSYAFKPPGNGILISSAYAASCGVDRFSPRLPSASCQGTEDNRTVLSVFDSCTAGRHDEFTLSGTVKLSFNASSTCDTWINGVLPASGSVTRTSSSFVRLNSNGSYVTTHSNPHQNYLGNAVSGGVQTGFLPATRSINILGLHKVRTRANGVAGFDHSIYTVSPLVVSGLKVTNNRKIESGTIRVDHNRAHYSTTASFAGLRWDVSCCHPSEGQVSFNLVGSEAGELKVDFSTGSCGLARITFPNGKTNDIQLASCE